MHRITPLVLLALSIGAVVAQTNRTTRYLLDKPKCTEKRMSQIELKAAKVVSLGPKGRSFPENERQLKRYCR